MIEALGNAVRTEILRRLSAEPTTALDLARAIGVAHSSIHRHLALLEDRGFVSADTPPEHRGGRAIVRWSANPGAVRSATAQWLSYATGGSVSGSDDAG